MKRGSTIFLKLVLCVMGLIGVALAIFALPSIPSQKMANYPYLLQLAYLFMTGLYMAAVPFYIALYEAWQLLNYIDKNVAFSPLSVKALKYIKYSAVAVSVCFAMGLPFLYMFAELDDAPGLIIISTAFAASPLVVATFAAVLQKLIANGLDIKSENDLTV
jgi:hypothetical protein